MEGSRQQNKQPTMEVAVGGKENKANGGSKEGSNFLGPPTFTELPNGSLKCVETGHQMVVKDKDSYAQSKLCRLGLIDFALSHAKPPLNMFKQDPLSRSKLICKLTDDTVNKTEERIWKHINGKRFLNKLEQKETEDLPDETRAEESEQKQKKEKKKKKEKAVEEIISEVRDPAENESDSEEPKSWMPPVDGNEQKRKRMKSDSDISRVSPSMRSHIKACVSLKDEQVAARVTSYAETDDWFVVKVINFDEKTKEFEVLDEEPGDDEEGGGQRKYKLPASCIIPFPKRNDPSSTQEVPAGKHVLAVYPGTTALYKATVIRTPRKRKSDEYLLEFDDDEEDGALPQRTVPFHKVVPLPEGHRQ